eukprot:gene2409-1512_t
MPSQVVSTLYAPKDPRQTLTNNTVTQKPTYESMAKPKDHINRNLQTKLKSKPNNTTNPQQIQSLNLTTNEANTSTPYANTHSQSFLCTSPKPHHCSKQHKSKICSTVQRNSQPSSNQHTMLHTSSTNKLTNPSILTLNSKLPLKSPTLCYKLQISLTVEPCKCHHRNNKTVTTSKIHAHSISYTISHPETGQQINLKSYANLRYNTIKQSPEQLTTMLTKTL